MASSPTSSSRVVRGRIAFVSDSGKVHAKALQAVRIYPRHCLARCERWASCVDTCIRGWCYVRKRAPRAIGRAPSTKHAAPQKRSTKTKKPTELRQTRTINLLQPERSTSPERAKSSAPRCETRAAPTKAPHSGFSLETWELAKSVHTAGDRKT